MEKTVIAASWHFACHSDDSRDINEMESVTLGLLGLDGFSLNANCFDPRSFGESPFGSC